MGRLRVRRVFTAVFKVSIKGVDKHVRNSSLVGLGKNCKRQTPAVSGGLGARGLLKLKSATPRLPQNSVRCNPSIFSEGVLREQKFVPEFVPSKSECPWVTAFAGHLLPSADHPAMAICTASSL